MRPASETNSRRQTAANQGELKTSKKPGLSSTAESDG
jgi:hypothetical protein